MEAGKNNLVLSFSQSEDIIGEVKKLMDAEKVDYVEFLSAKGRVMDFTVLCSGQNAALTQMSFKEEFGVRAISGKIEKANGRFVPNIYISLSKDGVGSFSGQLVKALATEGLEIKIRKINLKKIING